jgi:hypothetical protein
VPLQVLQRPYWTGTPRETGELFILHKNRREARALLVTHQLGWEVRLMIGAQAEVVQTQVCRTQEGIRLWPAVDADHRARSRARTAPGRIRQRVLTPCVSER